MSFRGAMRERAKIFDHMRDMWASETGAARRRVTGDNQHYFRRGNDWILFGPQDVRHSKPEYHYSLIYTEIDRTVRVRAGCRFYTIEQAWKHWAGPRYYNKTTGKMALAIITVMLLQAQSYGLMSPGWRRNRRNRFKVPTPKLPARIKR
jgi:hypothetical protein